MIILIAPLSCFEARISAIKSKYLRFRIHFEKLIKTDIHILKLIIRGVQHQNYFGIKLLLRTTLLLLLLLS